jgi:hypothetical protein
MATISRMESKLPCNFLAIARRNSAGVMSAFEILTPVKQKGIQSPDHAYCSGLIPNFLIRESNVVRLIPMRAAAPSTPPTRPLL